MKQCTRCKKIKDETAFSRHSCKSDGLRCWCRDCEAVYRRKYYKTHAVEAAAYQREYSKAHPKDRTVYQHEYGKAHVVEKAAYGYKYYRDHHTEIAACLREYYKARRVEKLAYQREYGKSHAAELTAYKRQYNKAHPEKKVMRSQRRKELVLLNGRNDLVPAQWAGLLDYFQNRCAYCLRPMGADATIDHMRPLCKGGEHTISNIVPACKPCNSKKGTKTLLEFLWGRDFIPRL